jgi:hypothetical protein
MKDKAFGYTPFSISPNSYATFTPKAISAGTFFTQKLKVDRVICHFQYLLLFNFGQEGNQFQWMSSYFSGCAGYLFNSDILEVLDHF